MNSLLSGLANSQGGRRQRAAAEQCWATTTESSAEE